jgi:FkbM family methyltransferase
MIIAEKSKNIEIDINQENLKKRYDYYKDTADSWKESFLEFPEEMLYHFIIYLRKLRETKDNFTFFDIGAAEGVYSYETLKEFKKGNIFCFEPEYERYKVLEENINEYFKQNENETSVNILQKIVNDGSKLEEYLRHYECLETGEGAGSSSIVSSDRPNRRSIDVKYEATSLDKFLYLDFVDAIKIDVEGAEIKVLNGSIEFLKKFKPLIFLEIHKDEMYGGISIDMVKDFFEKNNIQYIMNHIESKHHLEYVHIELK